MEINITIGKWMMKLLHPIDLDNKINYALMQAGNYIRNSAKENSPLKTGTLRRSITANFNQIKDWIVLVWSPVAYARIREYVNNLHPDRKFYFKNAYEENQDRIRELFNDALASAFK